MKKLAYWILLALMVTLALWGFNLLPLATSSNPLNKSLAYFIEHPSKLSFDPQDSDLTANAVLMKHLVGTLVRYRNGGQFEPYLASGFEKSADGLSWTFTLKPNLRCQNGEAITPTGYKKSFSAVARKYASDGMLPILSNLNGWHSYVNGEELLGLQVIGENQIKFVFSKAVGPGFLEYLSMPYFGYLCAGNFKNGKWINSTSIISSGPYAIDHLLGEKQVRIKLRKDWPLNPETAPEAVDYSGTIESASWESKNAVVQTSLGWDQKEPANFQKVWGPPDIIRSIVLDDGPSHFFGSLLNRRVLRAEVNRVKSEIPMHSKVATIAKSFYPGFDLEINESTVPLKSADQPQKKLVVFVPTTETDESKFIFAVLERALVNLRWPFEILKPGDASGLSATDVRSRDRFDVRISNVVAGSAMEPWVVEMMFCSNLGVSFPDPSKSICEYVREVMADEQHFDPRSGSEKLSILVQQDAAVLPVYHGHMVWYFSDSLDINEIAGDLILPSFEDIRIRN